MKREKIEERREAYQKYLDGEISKSEAKDIIGDSWDETVTGVMMKESMKDIDWEERYSSETDKAESTD